MIVCGLAAAIAIGGIFYVGVGQQRVLDAVRATPAQLGTQSYTYTDKDGEPHVVSVSGDARDPDALVRVLKQQIEKVQTTYPRR